MNVMFVLYSYLSKMVLFFMLTAEEQLRDIDFSPIPALTTSTRVAKKMYMCTEKMQTKFNENKWADMVELFHQTLGNKKKT